MEACADLQQRGYAPTIPDVTCGGGGDMGEEFQQSAFACAILADDADHVTLLHLEADVLECPDIIAMTFGAAVVDLAYL